jgi:hypothetical protein
MINNYIFQLLESRQDICFKSFVDGYEVYYCVAEGFAVEAWAECWAVDT